MPISSLWSLIVSLALLALGLTYKIAELTHRMDSISKESEALRSELDALQKSKDKEISGIKELHQREVDELRKKLVQPAGIFKYSLKNVDNDIRDLAMKLFPGCSDDKTELDRRPKQGQVSRIDLEHVVFGRGTVRIFFDKMPAAEILKISADIGRTAANSLCDHIRKQMNMEQAKEILNQSKKIFGLLSFWDDTGGWGAYEADTNANGQTQWTIEIKNHFLSDDAYAHIAIDFWQGYFDGFAKTYCNIKNEQNRNDKSQIPLIPTSSNCVERPTVDGRNKIVCTITLSPIAHV